VATIHVASLLRGDTINGSKAQAHQATPTLEQIFSEHASFVFRILRHLGVREADLDDLVQDVFLVARRRLTTLRADASARSWLFGIARRVASHHRRGMTRAERRVASMPAPLPDPDPEDELTRRDRVRFVHEFLGKLDERQRIALMLSDMEGMAAPEIASATGINVDTVYTRLRSARQAFARAARARGMSERP